MLKKYFEFFFSKKKEHKKRFYSLVAYTPESQIELRFALRRTVSEIQGKTYLDMDIWINVTMPICP